MTEPTVGSEYSLADPVIARAAVAAASERTEWNTEQLREDFEVQGFSFGICVVKRKSDGQLGSLHFDHAPRRYYGWQAHT